MNDLYKVSDNTLIIHALNYTANATETGTGVMNNEERKALKLPIRKIPKCDMDYVARLRSIAKNIK